MRKDEVESLSDLSLTKLFFSVAALICDQADQLKATDQNN